MDAGTRSFITVVLAADLLALVYFGGRFMATGSILSHKEHDHIVVAGAEHGADAATKPKKAAPVFDLATYIPDIKKGAKVAAKCKACHGFDEGGKNKTGPNLWGIYNAPIGQKAGFGYSGVMSGFGGNWNDEQLQAFLLAPKKYMPGTKMQYNGIKKPDQRADLIAWLKTLQ